MFDRLPQNAHTRERAAHLIDDFRQDLAYARRQLRRAPAFASLVIATLAIGIGANATMVGVIDRLLFRPPPSISKPDELVRLVTQSKNAKGEATAGGNYDYPMMVDFKAGISELRDVSGYSAMDGLSFASDDPSSELNATLVSPDFFHLFGITPALGSFFGNKSGYPTTASNGGPAFVVLGYNFWQRQFGGSPTVLGRSLQIGKITYTVIGVAPRDFRGVEATSRDAWIPITVALDAEQPMLPIMMHGFAYLQIIGRLAPGATPALVGAKASSIVRPYYQNKYDVDKNPHVTAAPIVRGRGPDAPREVKLTLWLGGVSALVLLIVCANVANLLLGRAFTRRREIAVRLALGAGRGRLARQLVTEAMLLSVLGAAFGLYLAAFGSRVIQRLLSTDMGSGAFIDARLLLFTVLVTLATGVLVSLAPMLQSTTPDLSNGLRTSANGGVRGEAVRTTLLATQAALCVVLLIGAGLFAQSLRRVQALDLGVDLEHTLQANLVGARQLPLSNSATLALLQEMQAAIRALPGVENVSLAGGAFGGGWAINITPPTTGDQGTPFRVPNRFPYRSIVDSNFFHTLGTRSLRGRDFTAQDRLGTPFVTILNAPLARQLFPGADALGKCVLIHISANARDGPCFEIVGILDGFNRDGILSRDAMVAYVPIAQQTHDVPYSMYVRTTGDAAAMTEVVRRTIQRIRPDMRRVSVKAVADIVEPEMRPWNLAAGMFVLFGAVALIIATIGLYAVVSFSVAQRTNEIAIRLALGARTRNVATAIGNRSIIAVAGGLGVGVLIALFARRWIGPLLFQTSPSDPWIIGGVGAMLFGVAVLAMVVPLVRALRVSPAQVLREG